MMPFLAALLAMLIGCSLTPGNEVYSFVNQTSAEHRQVNYTKIIAKWASHIHTDAPLKIKVHEIIPLPSDVDTAPKGSLAMWVELRYPNHAEHFIIFVSTTSVFQHKMFDPSSSELDALNPKKDT